MNEQEILKFRQSVVNCTKEELIEKQKEIQDAISKMILDSDLIIKAAIIENLIKENQNV